MSIDPEMAEVVRREVGEALDDLLALTDRFSEGAVTSEQLVREAFRIFHNTKGALRLGGFSSPERIAHAVEDHLSDLREQQLAPAAELIDVLEQALSACVYAVDAGGDHPELALTLERLRALAPGKKTAPVRKGVRGSRTSTKDAGTQDEASKGPASTATARDAIRIDGVRLDRLMNLGSEYLAQHSRLRRQRDDLRAYSDRVTSLLRRDPELREQLGDFATDFESFVRNEERELRRTTQLTADFDRAMREVRMQPVSGVVPQLRRIVTEASRELEKKAHLSVDFGEVELDREVLDALREPLMHLLRNAVDHGLEGAEERTKNGKPERGEVRVSARVSGANVEISVSDDGRGVNIEKLRKKAREKGIFGDVETLSDVQLIDALLFAPGFSTAAQVTNLSGRGVGLDVVRSRVNQLGGQVLVDRNEGAGVTFTVSVPASVVSLRGLSVAAEGATFVLPSSHVIRTLRVRTEDVGSAEGVTTIRTAQGEPLRLRWLSSEMGLRRSDDPAILQVVVVAEGSHELGLVVDEVQGDTTYVIKRFPWNVEKAQGVIGATHQGNATLALVIDMTHLFRGQSGRIEEHRVKVAQRRVKRRILVADDSLTSRTLERNILTGAGYEVRVVEDGQQALDVLETEDFDLLVSDVQMPNMDGLELTRRVRVHVRASRLPIILVTSLDRPEDVQAGSEAGADEYIVKGQFDQDTLLRAVSRLL